MSLDEWKKLDEGSTKTEVKFGVDMSDLGPGVLFVRQTVYTNGGKFIFPEFFPNAAKTYVVDGEERQFSEVINAPKGGYKNGIHAIRLMRERFNMKFKVAKFNTIHENDPKED